MRPLIIGQEEKLQLSSLRSYAEKNPYSVDDALDIIRGRQRPPGDDPQFTRVIPFDYRVVFTIQEKGFDKYRILSVSVPVPGSLPSVPAVNMIMEELGFLYKIGDMEVTVSLEKDIAIKVYEQII